MNLNSRYDVIVLTDENVDIIKTGKPIPRSRYASYIKDILPGYECGIGKESKH